MRQSKIWICSFFYCIGLLTNPSSLTLTFISKKWPRSWASWCCHLSFLWKGSMPLLVPLRPRATTGSNSEESELTPSLLEQLKWQKKHQARVLPASAVLLTDVPSSVFRSYICLFYFWGTAVNYCLARAGRWDVTWNLNWSRSCCVGWK